MEFGYVTRLILFVSCLTALSQINRRRISPGEPHLLRDGDTIFFAICELEKPDEDVPPRHKIGKDFAYTYKQFTTSSPLLAPDHQESWNRLDTLERSLWRIEDDLDRLNRERDVILREKEAM